jgi:hypothetical protein
MKEAKKQEIESVIKAREMTSVELFLYMKGMNRICWLRIAREFIDNDFARF